MIDVLSRESDVPVSIDTYKSEVASRVIEAGAEIINDISGLRFDPELASVAAKTQTPIILMHIRGTPETMQKDVHYDSLFSEIIAYLKESIRRAESAGVDPEQIVVDPGIGFGKTLEDNLNIIDAWVFGFLPETETCEGWTFDRIEILYDKVTAAWMPYGHLASRLPPELRERHAQLYGEAIRHAREHGWDPGIDEDE